MIAIDDVRTTLAEIAQKVAALLNDPKLTPAQFDTLKAITATLEKVETALAVPQTVLPLPHHFMPPADLLNIMCAAIKDFEGWAAPGETLNGTTYSNGSPAWQCKNPGNLRCALGSRANWNHLATGSRNGFCVFKDEATGLQAQKDVILSAASGKAPAGSPYQIYAHQHGLASSSELTLLQYMIVRDPPSDSNDPERYAKYIGDRMGVDYSTWQLKALIG